MISEENENEMNRVSKSVEPSQKMILARNFNMIEEKENAGGEFHRDATTAEIARLAKSIS